MLHEFISLNRQDLIDRCRSKVARRLAVQADDSELAHGVSCFIDQVVETLEIEETSSPLESRRISGRADGMRPADSEIGDMAAMHGRDLLARGYTIDQVVHDYGDLCQAVTDLAVERGYSMGSSEFRTLNRCLDNAIAEAATAYNQQRDLHVSVSHTNELNEHLGILTHELRNLLNSAMLALTAIRAGRVGVSGATASVLDASLVGMRNLINRSLVEVRRAAGMPVQRELFSLADFIDDVKLAGALEAQLEECDLKVIEVDPRLALEADRDLLFSAVGNLLQNACKFTHRHSDVTLHAHAVDDRILIEVADHCGGLREGAAESMFEAFTQGTENKGGLGLGLSIARRSVEANRGTLSVRDRPGTGCVFTVDLPRCEMPRPALRW